MVSRGSNAAQAKFNILDKPAPVYGVQAQPVAQPGGYRESR